MSCRKLEADIALHSGGDLPAARVPRVEQHLADCADCRMLWDELRAGQALLAALRDEPLEDAMVSQVRRRVLARIDTPRTARLYWTLALAATLILAVVLAWPRHSVPRGAVRRTAAAPRAVPADHAVARVAAPTARKRRGVVRVRHARPPQPGAPLLVQFVTNDPNIVIYWLVDQKPQGD